MHLESTTGADIVLAGLTISHTAATQLGYGNYLADEERRAKINKLYIEGDITAVFEDDDPVVGETIIFPAYTAGELEENSYGDHEFFVKVNVPGVLTAVAGAEMAPLPHAGLLKKVQAKLGTYVAGAAMILDVNKNGTTVFTTQADRPTIADGQSAIESDGPWTVADVAHKQYAEGDVVSVDVDQIGTTSGHHGSDLDVVLTFQKQSAEVIND